MAFRIIISPRAEKEYEGIVEYVLNDFGISRALKLYDSFLTIRNQIAINPNQFPFFNKGRNIRYCVLSHQTTLYYRLDGNSVELISFRSNWMNHSRNKATTSGKPTSRPKRKP